jgi:hypothetical protein
MSEIKNNLPENAKLVFKWKIFDTYQWEQKMFDWSTKIFEKIKRNDSIDVVAIADDWKIYVLKETQPWRDWFYWLIWWTCEDWESPIDTAKRELLEETWLISKDWKIFNSYSTSSKIVYHSHTFIARNCKKIQEQNLDQGWEKIKIKKLNWNEFLDIIVDPRFRVKEFSFDVLKYIFLWKEEKLKWILFD